MTEVLLLLRSPDLAQEVIGTVEDRGGRVLQRFGRRVIVVATAKDDIRQSLAKAGRAGVEVFSGSVPTEKIPSGDTSAEFGVRAWNERHTPRFVSAKENRPGQGLSWGHPDFEREGRGVDE